MSNVEQAPAEVECRPDPTAVPGTGVELIEPRDVPLGGPRAMTVRRTLPQRRRSLVGAWCFVDHYGPDDHTMRVPGHPHTGLQTVSWLFAGEVEHRDTTGAHAIVRPGELNLMTAGVGIAHSELSVPASSGAATLHGAQLWVALPDAHRFVAPGFESHVPPAVDLDGATARVFLGSLAGSTSPATTYSPLLGAEIVLPPGHRTRLAVEPSFEHAVLVDRGEPTVDGTRTVTGQLAYRAPGSSSLELAHDGPDATGPVRVLLLGGAPFAERIIMWWNFVGRHHEEIVEFRARWQDERSGRAGQFGRFPAVWTETLPAPPLPGTRLVPRG